MRRLFVGVFALLLVSMVGHSAENDGNIAFIGEHIAIINYCFQDNNIRIRTKKYWYKSENKVVVITVQKCRLL